MFHIVHNSFSFGKCINNSNAHAQWVDFLFQSIPAHSTGKLFIVKSKAFHWSVIIFWLITIKVMKVIERMKSYYYKILSLWKKISNKFPLIFQHTLVLNWEASFTLTKFCPRTSKWTFQVECPTALSSLRIFERLTSKTPSLSFR